MQKNSDLFQNDRSLGEEPIMPVNKRTSGSDQTLLIRTGGRCPQADADVYQTTLPGRHLYLTFLIYSRYFICL